jgi:hypothetical protein
MDTRPRTRLLRRAGVLAALALLAPATAGAATAQAAKKKTKAPVITRVTPLSLNVGDTLVIRGRNFRSGRLKNTVVFKRDGGRAVFVKAEIGTKKLIRVKIPAMISTSLAVRNGGPVPTRFRLRVLTTKLSRSFTAAGRSPVIGPEKPADPAPGAGAADGDCDGDHTVNAIDTDDDNDLLPDTTELTYKLDPCNADTDGDGVTDGYEYRSAQDLNNDSHQEPNGSVPYPGKRPYPNPLDKTDANTDFDGDTLTLTEEFQLWRKYGNPSAALDQLNYSDGMQYSVYSYVQGDRRRPALAAAGYGKQQAFLDWATASGYRNVFVSGLGPAVDIRDADRDGTVEGSRAGYIQTEDQYYDLDRSGWLSDDERDEDADGLTNYDEAHGRMVNEYWTSCYKPASEKPFHIGYAGTDLADADSDGDGILDGADDQDHDNVPNLMELSRNAASSSARFDWDPTDGVLCRLDEAKASSHGTPAPPQGRVNPFNPCLPETDSDFGTCPVIAGDWAPFDGSPNYFVLQ